MEINCNDELFAVRSDMIIDALLVGTTLTIRYMPRGQPGTIDQREFNFAGYSARENAEREFEAISNAISDTSGECRLTPDEEREFKEAITSADMIEAAKKNSHL